MKHIIVALVITALLSGCSEQPVSKIDSQPQAKKQVASKEVYGVGNLVKIGSTQVIIKTARLKEGNAYALPKKGKVLELEVEGHNLGNQSWFLSDADFNLYDKTGAKLESYFGFDDLPLSGEVNKGKKVSGKLFYDVPEAESYELIYKPNFLTDQEIIFNIVPDK